MPALESFDEEGEEQRPVTKHVYGTRFASSQKRKGGRKRKGKVKVTSRPKKKTKREKDVSVTGKPNVELDKMKTSKKKTLV